MEILKGQQYLYLKQEGSKILAVAHCDSVNTKHWFGTLHHPMIGDIVFSDCLDDRLGVHIITKMLPQLDIHTDILLTQGEETGNSTAKLFIRDIAEGKLKIPDYNWLVEFDREGTDVVRYQYEDTDWIKILENFFPDVNHGSFTDIVSMGSLGICGVNVGIGNRDSHNDNSRATLQKTEYMMNLFKTMYEEFKNIRVPHSATYENEWRSYRYTKNYGSQVGMGFESRTTNTFEKTEENEQPIGMEKSSSVHVVDLYGNNGISHIIARCPYCDENNYIFPEHERNDWTNCTKCNKPFEYLDATDLIFDAGQSG